jgi:hypothetical protein
MLPVKTEKLSRGEENFASGKTSKTRLGLPNEMLVAEFSARRPISFSS